MEMEGHISINTIRIVAVFIAVLIAYFIANYFTRG